jgi:hypothetical protein
MFFPSIERSQQDHHIRPRSAPIKVSLPRRDKQKSESDPLPKARTNHEVVRSLLDLLFSAHSAL